MKQLSLATLALIAGITLFTACKKKNDATNISVKQTQIGSLLTGDTLCGHIKGTMISGKTYVMTCPVTVNFGDTLLMQRGVTVDVRSSSAYFLIQGAFISLGTKDSANWITVKSITKQDNVGSANNPTSDPAFTNSGVWLGFQCDTSCQLVVMKWTHLEFAGGTFGTTPPMTADKAGSNAYPVYITNPNAVFVFEDSWLYGGIDDGMRPNCNFIIQRSTFEKEGYIGGDCINPKHGGYGIAAYNMFIGCATNGTKASDKGSGSGHVTVTDYFNNTYVNGGYRQQQTGRGGDINYEQGASGQSYNNLIVDCKFGFRIVGNPIADTAHCRYGYNLSYGDADSIVDQFYPVGYYSYYLPTNIPNPVGTIPATDTLGSTYTAHAWVGANNPLFVNYPLGTAANINIDFASGYDFHLQSSSPAIGKGYTGFSANVPPAIKVDPVFGPSSIPVPSKDLGCYPSDGSGNKH
jgi:hypothetical protein